MNPMIGLIATATGVPVGYLIGHRIAKAMLASRGPECDRCGKPTRRPHLWRSPVAWWRCNACEEEVIRIIWEHAASETEATELFRRYTGVIPDINPTTEENQ